MNLGKLDPELEKFVTEYKKYGYSTRTQLANDALRLLKRHKATEARKRWREEAAKETDAAASGRAWESIDAEDYKK